MTRLRRLFTRFVFASRLLATLLAVLTTHFEELHPTAAAPRQMATTEAGRCCPAGMANRGKFVVGPNRLAAEDRAATPGPGGGAEGGGPDPGPGPPQASLAGLLTRKRIRPQLEQHFDNRGLTPAAAPVSASVPRSARWGGEEGRGRTVAREPVSNPADPAGTRCGRSAFFRAGDRLTGYGASNLSRLETSPS